MKNYYFFKIIKQTTLQFLDLFNDIQVAKYDSSGNILKYVNVPLKLSGKQKFYYWAHDRKNIKRLPMMAVNLVGIENAVGERGKNKSIKIPISRETHILQPSPYNFEFELFIGSLYVSEIEQILEQILPFFTPYVVIRLNLPEINNYFDVTVIFNSATAEDTVEIPEEDYRLVNWTLNFTAKGSLLRPIQDSSLIEEIYLKIRNMRFYENPSLSGDGTYETMYLSGYKDDDDNLLYEYEILD